MVAKFKNRFGTNTLYHTVQSHRTLSSEKHLVKKKNLEKLKDNS